MNATARPLPHPRLARALAVLMAMALILLPAVLTPAAQAEVIVPTLLGTEPESPGASTEPRIVGRLGGDGTSSTGPIADSGAPAGPRAIDPNATITIYADEDCLGPVEATGTVAQLAEPGIAVQVDPDSTTTFYATETEGSETSDCSHGLAYRHVSSAPPVPALGSVTPASPADNNLPRLLGAAAAEATIAIHTDPGCSGAPVATGAGGDLAGGGIPVAVPDNSTTTFYAVASWGGFESACSTTFVTYQEITLAPPVDPGGPGETEGQEGGLAAPPPTPGRPAPPKLRTAPGARAHDTTPLLLGSAPGAARVEVHRGADCDGAQVATGSVADFLMGFPVRVDPNTATSFSAVAIDSDGERSRCSDPVAYTEDSAAPVTRITFGPGVKTHKRSAVFRFADITGDPPGTAFVCKLDRREWQACQSPWRVPRLRVREHVVRVRATDVVGNQEPVGAKRRFKVVARNAR